MSYVATQRLIIAHKFVAILAKVGATSSSKALQLAQLVTMSMQLQVKPA